MDWIVAVQVLLICVAGLWLVSVLERRWVSEFLLWRIALFSDFTEGEIFSNDKSYSTASTRELARIRRRMEKCAQTNALLSNIGRCSVDRERVTEIVRWMTREPSFTSGKTRIAGSLVDRAVQIHCGLGICGDHVRVFLGLAAVLGLRARFVLNGDHSCAEYFDAQHHRWFMVDPTLALFLFDDKGRQMGFCEVRSALLRGNAIDLRYISSRKLEDLAIAFYAHGNVFWKDAIRMTGGSPRIASNLHRYPRFFPKSIFQMGLHLSGRAPRFEVLLDSHSISGNLTSRVIARKLVDLSWGEFLLRWRRSGDRGGIDGSCFLTCQEAGVKKKRIQR